MKEWGRTDLLIRETRAEVCWSFEGAGAAAGAAGSTAPAAGATVVESVIVVMVLVRFPAG